MPEHAQNVGYEPTILEFQAFFPIYSHMTSMGKPSVTFLVNEEIIPIKMEKILVI